jgi:HK97 family phage major capsid protein
MNQHVPRPFLPVSTAPKGRDFVRAAIALATSPDDPTSALGYACSRFGETSAPALLVRAAVTAGGTNTWGEELALPVTEFIGAVNERSVAGRLANLRRVPLNVRTITATSPSTGFWVGEGAPKPVSGAGYTSGLVQPLKVAAMVVVTDEVLRSSSPNAEASVRNDLLNAVVRELNSAFLDETNAGISGVMPASVTNAVTPVSGSGDMADDLQLLLANFQGNLETATFIGHPVLFASLSGANYPGLGGRGGTLLGFPAIASSQVSPDTLILLDSDGIAYAEGSAEIRVSRQATIQMLDNPTNNSATGTATQAVSLFQTNAVALLCEISVNWSVARPGSVAVLTTSSV